jgi:poly-gamma-glutamate synthesis protein (capsule biosynthesis protein)
MTRTLRLGFVGDVMLGRLVDERQRRRAITAVWGDVLEELRSLDGLFVNLECCLSNRGEPWTRTYRPFLFRASPDWAVPALTDAGVDWAALANNHVLDFGERALRDTLDALDDAGIERAGAGRTRGEAWTPAVVDVGDLRVALVAFTDNTPEYEAGPQTPGTAHAEIDADDEETVTRVERALASARAADPDLVVASLHWGPNMVTSPPARFRELAHWLVTEGGVDLLHGHSAHVFQAVEVHEGAPVLYDTGDFVDDYAVDDSLRNDRSFLFEVVVDADAAAIDRIRLVPTEIDGCSVHHASPSAAEWCRATMRERSSAFDTEFERDGEALLVRV